MTRTQIRELTFKLIFSIQLQKDDKDLQVENFIKDLELNETSSKYILDTFYGVEKNITDIEGLIKANIKQDWTLERLSKVDIAILKLAIYEIKYANLPFKVVINEAVEIAKAYGDDNSPSFVNGVLAKIIKE